MKKNKPKDPTTAEEFDEYFENNDIAHLLDTETKRINLDIPAHIVLRLDRTADRLGLTRQALIKYWIAERLNLVGNK